MPPKKRSPGYWIRSKNHSRLKQGKILRDNDCFPNSSYSETILHRLRPRIQRVKRASEIITCKVCYNGPKSRRRKRTRRYIERHFVQYKTKHHRRSNRNPRGNHAAKSVAEVKARTIFRRSIHPSEILVRLQTNRSHEKNQRKSSSFIHSIKDYIFSVIREGTRWANRYVYQSFKRDNKSEKSSRTSPKREIIRSGDLPCSSHVTEPGQVRDHKDKSRMRYKSRNICMHRSGDGFGNTTPMKCRELRDTEDKLHAGNPQNLQPPISDVTSFNPHRRDNLQPHKRDGQRRSRSIKGERRKRAKRNKRIAYNVARFNEVANDVRESNSFSGNNVRLINSEKPTANSDPDLKKHQVSSSKDRADNFGDKPEVYDAARSVICGQEECFQTIKVSLPSSTKLGTNNNEVETSENEKVKVAFGGKVPFKG